MNLSLQGALKSVTIIAAALIALLSNLAPLIPDYLALLGLSAHTIQIVGSTLAGVMVVLRTITKQSLADKGANVPVPTPPTTKQAGFAHVRALVVLASVALMTMVGCASLKSFFGSSEGETAVTVAVDVAVATAEAKGVTAAQINKVAKAALAADTGVSGTLAAVSTLVNAQIAGLHLPALDQAAAEILEAALSAAIQAKLGNDPNVASAQVAVADVAKAVIAATGG